MKRDEDRRAAAPAGEVSAIAAGVTTCPCACSEREDDAHHSSDFLVTAEEYPEHPAAQAGYEGWEFCIHCGAWRADDDDAPDADWVP
ncbi:hypothetical protein GTZ93_16675 [Corallococcus exiguus]|uniref:Uncharacterized protein n=1 Tax=Corallococcus exiguus TaxID=83462 RepID=A0A7X4Y9K8_9BACT|nr:hypothetical protein [Corallococcus exiguus]TNV67158.1 hypothetical protein FH620_02755 [Corallococcus exiguus]